MIEGKIEAGLIRKDGSYLIMPNRKKVSISALYGETEEEIEGAKAGDQVRIRIRGVEEEDLSAGFVLCLPTRPCVSTNYSPCQILQWTDVFILACGPRIRSSSSHTRNQKFNHFWLQLCRSCA
jgi:peptide chain release factor subunit 3